MGNNNFDGLDAELQQEETSKESNITSFEEAKKKRKPFHYWTVDGVDHKMKLTTDMILMCDADHRPGCDQPLGAWHEIRKGKSHV